MANLSTRKMIVSWPISFVIIIFPGWGEAKLNEGFMQLFALTAKKKKKKIKSNFCFTLIR
jgi:hypothetical protein